MSSAHTVSHIGQVLPGVFTLLRLPGAASCVPSGGEEATGGRRPEQKKKLRERLGYQPVCQGFGKLMRERGVCSPFLNGATSVFRFLVWNDTLW